MDQSIFLAFYSFTSSNVTLSVLAVFFTSSSTTLSVLAIFFAKWFPYFLVLAAGFYVIFESVSRGIARPLLLPIFVSPAIAWLIADVVKAFFPTMRPFAALHFTPLVLGENPLGSFPSGHATFFAALGVAIFLRNKKVGAWFLVGALVVGLARVAVGVHYPLDILAGFLLGGLIALLVHHALRKFSEKPPAPVTG